MELKSEPRVGNAPSNRSRSLETRTISTGFSMIRKCFYLALIGLVLQIGYTISQQLDSLSRRSGQASVVSTSIQNASKRKSRPVVAPRANAPYLVHADQCCRKMLCKRHLTADMDNRSSPNLLRQHPRACTT